MTMQDERPRIEVREPLTYTEDAPRSYFRDLVMSQCFRDDDATARLEQHGREMRVERAERERRGSPLERTPEGDPIEYRINPNSTLGTGGEFDVPLWLVSKFATAGRAGRPFGDLLQPMTLPAGCSSIHTPRINPGDITGSQSDGGVTPGQDAGTLDASSNVITLAGETVISQQLFDLSPIGMDAAFFLDINLAYNKNLEAQLLYGSPNGAGAQSAGQLLGVSNVTGANTVSGAGMNTVALLWPGLGQTAAAVGNLRLLPPTVCLMAPRRYYFVAFSVDSSNRPVGAPTGLPPKPSLYDPAGGATPVDAFGGMPVYLDGSIPALANPDDVFFLRPEDMFLWESAPRTIVATNPNSGTLQLTLSLHRYVAFIPQRYPTGIGRLSALPQPANY